MLAMLPWNYEFHWDVGHIIFFGAFYGVVAGIFLAFLIAIAKLFLDFRKRRVDAITWESEFHDLPQSRRRCRHEIAGLVPSRECHHGFDCRECEFHAKAAAVKTAAQAEPYGDVFGFDMPFDRLYHRGHTWVKESPDGTLLVGLDDFGTRVFGEPDRIALPKPGESLAVNGTAWRMKKGKTEVRVISPVEGKIIATGAPEVGWVLKVKPPGGKPRLSHLLGGAEMRAWMLKEFERLLTVMSRKKIALSFADGGQPVADMPRAYPGADWDAIWGDVFLES